MNMYKWMFFIPCMLLFFGNSCMDTELNKQNSEIDKQDLFELLPDELIELILKKAIGPNGKYDDRKKTAVAAMRVNEQWYAIINSKNFDLSAILFKDGVVRRLAWRQEAERWFLQN